MSRPTYEEKQMYGGLTKRQFEVLKFLTNYCAEHPYPPTLRETARGLGISPTRVRNHFVCLEQAGYISRDPYIPRGIWITQKIEELTLDDSVSS